MTSRLFAFISSSRHCSCACRSRGRAGDGISLLYASGGGQLKDFGLKSVAFFLAKNWGCP